MQKSKDKSLTAGEAGNTIRSKITKSEVEHVARLANINITQHEQERYSEELSEVINYNMEHLKGIDTSNVEPTGHVTGETTVTRPDEIGPGLSENEALGNAPSIHNNLFRVDHVFGEE